MDLPPILPRHRIPQLVLALLAFGGLGLHSPAVLAVAAEEPRFTWPLHPRPQVIRGFDAPESDFGPGHRGVDLAATADQQVLAAGTGYVVFAGTIAGRGVVSVDHDGDLRTTYEPLVPQVAAGDQVYSGQVLGAVVAGHPECTVAVCLHWGVRRGLEYLDPLPLILETTRLRLKPWDPG
ncbi:M23 family metallopeptidase [Amycolatopsis magusensis]|uniref:Murein DD-endopeptidase MepM/ murein hydrolase activator NlpD n=1 Tax=Amycolatopsis magusensis TaxID=882444 RepID=A0ABS4Q414_9PSEU|nr:M23 family metallopeptidase [Amycolatopsis magusensis]MBP2186421.1 murein DD-endopeptidase MepM/ murein hydrolase activator NlpD [Amycolatopsis magusensis]